MVDVLDSIRFLYGIFRSGTLCILLLECEILQCIQNSFLCFSFPSGDERGIAYLQQIFEEDAC